MKKRELKQLARTGEEIVRLHVLGAACGVTGSLNLVEVFRRDKTTRLLLDVGLHLEEAKADFQNRLPKGLKASDIDMVIISHAHIDHSGYLPKLIKDGYKGPVYVTPATQDLLGILLPDSGYLQEEEAKRKNKRRAKQLGEEQKQEAPKGRSAKKGAASEPAEDTRLLKPLYTEAEARASLAYLKPLDYDVRHELLDDIAVTLTDAGHILGSAVVTVDIGRGSRKRSLCFSGNIGRSNMPVLKDLKPIAGADYLIVESTYGNRRHKERNRHKQMAEILKKAHERALQKDPKEGCGVILIPAFAVGRAQVVLDDLRQLMESGAIPTMPVYLDGRMSISATEIHRKHADLLNDETR
ncbi:MAG: MBL fold metallo-hydrolase, partial [Cyanobacteria bacterium]|nr:MBL fold metallo-hydrolase [Cyanobacteriota bacterium]